MKTNITISIDQELARKLQEESNYSDVINEQMKGYYNVKTCENIETLNTKLAETKQILKENRKKKREIEGQLIKIDQKNKKFKKIMKQKGLTRSKLINQIIKRRAFEKRSEYTSTQYFETPDQEADRTLKGGL